MLIIKSRDMYSSKSQLEWVRKNGKRIIRGQVLLTKTVLDFVNENIKDIRSYTVETRDDGWHDFKIVFKKGSHLYLHTNFFLSCLAALFIPPK